MKVFPLLINNEYFVILLRDDRCGNSLCDRDSAAGQPPPEYQQPPLPQSWDRLEFPPIFYHISRVLQILNSERWKHHRMLSDRSNIGCIFHSTISQFLFYQENNCHHSTIHHIVLLKLLLLTLAGIFQVALRNSRRDQSAVQEVRYPPLQTGSTKPSFELTIARRLSGLNVLLEDTFLPVNLKIKQIFLLKNIYSRKHFLHSMLYMLPVILTHYVFPILIMKSIIVSIVALTKLLNEDENDECELPSLNGRSLFLSTFWYFPVLRVNLRSSVEFEIWLTVDVIEVEHSSFCCPILEADVEERTPPSQRTSIFVLIRSSTWLSLLDRGKF